MSRTKIRWHLKDLIDGELKPITVEIIEFIKRISLNEMLEGKTTDAEIRVVDIDTEDEIICLFSELSNPEIEE